MRIFCFTLVLAFSFSAHSINYFRCESKENCTKAYGGCGRYLALHKRYKELYEAKAHKADRVANCLPPSEKDKVRKHEGVVKCLKNSCRLLMPQSNKEG